MNLNNINKKKYYINFEIINTKKEKNNYKFL